MHFNIYVDDETGHQLKGLAEQRGQTRNALIRQALKEWTLEHSKAAGWPVEVLAFEGLPEIEAFEAHRSGMRIPSDDPLA